MLAGRISAKKEISSKTGKEGSIYPGRCRQGLSEDWTLKQGLGGQGEVAEVSPGEKHRETGWVAFRRGRGRCGRGRGRVAGKAEERQQAGRDVSARYVDFGFSAMGRPLLYLEMTGSVSEDGSHTIDYHLECKRNNYGYMQ